MWNLFPLFLCGHSRQCNSLGAPYLESDHGHPFGGPIFGWSWIYGLDLRLPFDLWFLEMYGTQQCWNHPTWAVWEVPIPQAASLHPHVSTNKELVHVIWAVNQMGPPCVCIGSEIWVVLLTNQVKARILCFRCPFLYFITCVFRWG